MEKNEEEKKESSSDNYKILIDKLDAMEKKYDVLQKKYDETLAMNRALLDRNTESSNPKQNTEERHKQLEDKLLKGLK